MTDAELDAIEARFRAATAGPWAFCHDNSLLVSPRGVVAEMSWGTDGEFAAHARTDVPALVAEVRRLRYNELSQHLRHERGFD